MQRGGILKTFWFLATVALCLFTEVASAQSCNGDKIFVSEWNTSNVRRYNIDGSGLNTQTSYNSQLYTVDVNSYAGQRIVSSWANNQLTTSDVNGAGEALLRATGAQPFQVEVDWLNGLVYWTIWSNTSSIWCARLDGTGGTTAIANNLYYPTGLEVDGERGFLYLHQSYTAPRQIQRAALNGSCGGITLNTIVSGDAVVGRSFGLTHDPVSGQIFSAEYDNQQIVRYNSDGSGRTVLYTGLGSQTTALDVHQDTQQLFWVQQDGWVRRAPIDGSGSATNVVNAGGSAWGLALCEDWPAPGGVGTNLAAWFRADKPGSFPADNAALQTWHDSTGNNLDATQGTLNNRPTYQSDNASLLNFNEVIRFDGVNDTLGIADTPAFNTTDQYLKSFVVAFRTGANVNNRQVIYEEGGNTRGINLYISANTLSYGSFNTTNSGAAAPWAFGRCTTPIQANTNYIATFVLQGNAAITGVVDCYLNGQNVGQRTGVGRLYTHNNNIGLGAKIDQTRYETGASGGNGEYFGGDIAEFIYYGNQALTPAERNRIESYLAVKYGITLYQTPAQNYAASNGTTIFAGTGALDLYDNDIAGIGVDDASDLSQPQSRSVNSDDIVTMQETGGLSSGDWLLWGNNNDDNGVIQQVTTGLAPGVSHRLDRVWRVDQESAPGAATVRFDVSAITVTGTSAADFNLLVKNSNNDFTTGATITAASSYAGGIVTFNTINFNPDDFFTLGTGRIPAVSLTVNSASIAENGGVATFTASIPAIHTSNITVNLSYSGTATNGTDYSASSTFITITAGTTSGSVTVTGTDDPNDETNESVIVDIASVVNGTENGVQQQTTTITDDDPPPTVTLSQTGSPIAENGGSGSFTANLSAASAFTVTVNLSYSGTASAGDYTASNTQIIIAPGATSGSVTITGQDDLFDENNETVIADIASVTNGTESGVQQATITITDDDSPPSVTLSDNSSSIAENGGVSTLTATLSAVSGLNVTVNLAYSGTASGSDYAAGTSITVLAGSLTGSTTVTGTDDSLDENNETVIVDISSVVNGTESGVQQRTITINDDDAPPTVTLSTTGSPIAENGGAGTFVATLNTASGLNVTVNLTYSGTAGGSDYTASGSSITINAGSLTGSVTVTGSDDSLDEDDETVVADISSVTNGTESGVQQQPITITDDDAPPNVTLSISPASMSELGGTSTVTATLDAVSGRNVTVNLGYSGSAVIGVDYSGGASIVISAGSLTGTTNLASIDDGVYEGDKDGDIDITSVVNGTESGVQQVTITIIEDEVACNLDPYSDPNGTTQAFYITADGSFDPTDPMIQIADPDDFDILVMGRNAAQRTARKALAINYFLTTYGIDFSTGDSQMGGQVLLAKFTSDDFWGLKVHAASDYRTDAAAGTIDQGYYAMVVWAPAGITVHGTWGGVGGIWVPQNTVAEFGEMLIHVPQPCTDNSTVSSTFYMEYETIGAQIADGTLGLGPSYPSIFDHRVTSPDFGVGTIDGLKELRNTSYDQVDAFVTAIVRFP